MNLLGGWDTDKDALLISVDSMLVDNVREIKGTDSTFAETSIEKYKVCTSKYFSSINMMMFQNKVMEATPSVGAITKNSEICTKMIRTLEDMIKYNNTQETPDGNEKMLIEEVVETLNAFQIISERAYKNFNNDTLRTNTGQIVKAVIETKVEQNCLNQDVLISLDRVIDDGNKSTKKDVVKEVISYTQVVDDKVKSLITACEKTYTDNDMLANIIETLKKIRSVYTFDQGAAIDIIKKNIKIEDNWINLYCDIKSNPKARVTRKDSLVNGIIKTELARELPNVRGNVDIVLNNLIYIMNRDSLLSLDLTGHGKNEDIVESGVISLNKIKKNNTMSIEEDLDAEDKFVSLGYDEEEYSKRYCYSVEHVLNLASSMYRNSYNHITQDMPIDAQFEARRDTEKAQTKENIELCRALLTSVSKGVNHMEFTHALYAYASAQSKFARKMSVAPLSINAQSDVKQTVVIKHAAKSPDANTIYNLEKGISKEGFIFGTSADKVIVKKEYSTSYVMVDGKEKRKIEENDVAYVLGNASDSFNQDSDIEDVTVFEYKGNLDCTDKTQLAEALNEMVILNNIENAERDEEGFYVHGELVTADNVNVIEINQRTRNQHGEEVKTIVGAYIIVKKMKVICDLQNYNTTNNQKVAILSGKDRKKEKCNEFIKEETRNLKHGIESKNYNNIDDMNYNNIDDMFEGFVEYSPNFIKQELGDNMEKSTKVSTKTDEVVMLELDVENLNDVKIQKEPKIEVSTQTGLEIDLNLVSTLANLTARRLESPNSIDSVTDGAIEAISLYIKTHLEGYKELKK
ncbi:MAG: hypothetical protein R3Y64_09660, partial [Peptostreptococcaceae bacterium]